MVTVSPGKKQRLTTKSSRWKLWATETPALRGARRCNLQQWLRNTAPRAEGAADTRTQRGAHVSTGETRPALQGGRQPPWTWSNTSRSSPLAGQGSHTDAYIGHVCAARKGSKNTHKILTSFLGKKRKEKVQPGHLRKSPQVTKSHEQDAERGRARDCGAASRTQQTSYVQRGADVGFQLFV